MPRHEECFNQRIPTSLQAVFLASNRGNSVHKPPPGKAASTTFRRSWMLPRRGNTNPYKAAKQQQQHPDGNEKGRIDAQTSEETPTRIRSDTVIGSPSVTVLSPQAYLDAILLSRGYSNRRVHALLTGYHNKPSPLQKASHSSYLVQLIRERNLMELELILSSGISPNPCNAHGESLLHMVCRRGDHELLKLFLHCGASVQVSDDYGRTPLHDAFWASSPSFETVRLILEQDSYLLNVMDSRGALPLSYVSRDQWKMWIDFFESHKDLFWPERRTEQEPPAVASQAPNSCPLPNPLNALNIQLTEMVASGRMKVSEAHLLMYDCILDTTCEEMTEDYSDEFQAGGHDAIDDDRRKDDSDDGDSICSNDTFDEEEMADILRCLGNMQIQPIRWSSY